MKEVLVEFVDAESGQTVERTTLPLDRVPDPLELKPRLTLGQARWVVVRAEPAAAKAVTASGRLRLTVRRVADLESADLDYGCPTLAPSLPPAGEPARLEERPAEEGAAVLGRDCWRQVELVARTHAEALTPQLLAIRRVRATARVVAGSVEVGRPRGAPQVRYDDLYLRQELLPQPVPPLGLEWLASQLPTAELRALALEGLRPVADGFALRGASGLLVYGAAPQGRVSVLGLAKPAPGLDGRAAYHDLRALSEVAEVHGLLLVDWVAARVYPASRFVDALA